MLFPRVESEACHPKLEVTLTPTLSLESDWDLSPKYSCPDYLILLGLAVATKFQLPMWVACFLHTLKDGQGKPRG